MKYVFPPNSLQFVSSKLNMKIRPACPDAQSGFSFCAGWIFPAACVHVWVSVCACLVESGGGENHSRYKEVLVQVEGGRVGGRRWLAWVEAGLREECEQRREERWAVKDQSVTLQPVQCLKALT